LFVYYDYSDGDGWYGELQLSHAKTINAKTQLCPGLTIGYSGGQWGVSGLTNLGLTVATKHLLPDDWTLSPALTYIVTPGDRANTENELVFSLGLSRPL
jgi:carbohydrate-selective porin OprB